ncbi:TadE/TadG family type IV pilus assembly protein [Phaeovulum sp.]|uniref:TadE/TadG family type IV pilus assembly protein n=1 Tax=Phaeovulum sp. TaxID=2934796 RepID=UPI0035640A2E
MRSTIAHFMARPRRFLRREDGNVTIPTVMFIPFFLMVFASSIELSTLSIRQSLLDRAVDDTARILKLGIEPLPDHTTLKRSICNRMAIAPNCMNDLKVEVFEIDKTTWTTALAGTSVACVDRTAEEQEESLLQRGVSDQLMLMRVCLKVDPMMPGAGVGAQLVKDPTGAVSLVVVTAFVNEPR